MSEAEVRVNAMIAEFNAHIQLLSGRAAQLAAELASARQEIENLKKPVPGTGSQS